MTFLTGWSCKKPEGTMGPCQGLLGGAVFLSPVPQSCLERRVLPEWIRNVVLGVTIAPQSNWDPRVLAALPALAGAFGASGPPWLPTPSLHPDACTSARHLSGILPGPAGPARGVGSVLRMTSPLQMWLLFELAEQMQGCMGFLCSP